MKYKIRSSYKYCFPNKSISNVYPDLSFHKFFQSESKNFFRNPIGFRLDLKKGSLL